MALETATYISQLNPANPEITDPLAQAYAHANLIKSVLQDQFPNLGTVAVTGSAVELNAATGAFGSGVLAVPANGTIASAQMDLLGLMNTGGTIVAGRVALDNGATAGAVGSLIIEMTDGTDSNAVVSATLSRAGNFAAAASVNAPVISQAGNQLLPIGSIILWYGSVASIPAGWQLCNGTNGTPNLMDVFVAGAGNTLVPNQTGGSSTASATTASAGSHSHTGVDQVAGAHSHTGATASYTLQIADMPSHNHVAASSLQEGAGHAHPLTYGTGGGGPNFPAMLAGTGSVTSQTDYATTGATVQTAIFNTGGSGGHVHGISSDGSHQHVITADGAHTHTVSVTTVPPYYALCYIMKVT